MVMVTKSGPTRGQVLIIGIVVLLILYLLYSYLSVAQKTRPPAMDTWKSVVPDTVVEVPKSVWDKADDMHVQEKTYMINTKGKVVETFARVVSPSSPRHPAVLLLHGARFSSKTWYDLRTLHMIAAMGHTAVAIDVPGYGQSPASTHVDPSQYLRDLVSELNIPCPVVVTASMSGGYVIPYVMGEEAGTAGQRATALVAVAPVQTKLYTHQQYTRLEIPVLIVRGEKDTNLGLEASSSLQNARSNKYVEFPKAGHACYLDDPQRWHLELYKFLLGIERHTEDHANQCQ